MSRRTYGTGSLFVRQQGKGKGAQDVYYGQWRAGGKIIKRRIGPVRVNGTREGFTKTQAEAALRRLMQEVAPEQVAPATRVGVEEAGKAYIASIEPDRKPTTVQDYRIILRRHLVPAFEAKAMGKITPQDVKAYITTKRRKLSASSVRNQVNLLGAIFEHAIDQGWATDNPTRRVKRPKVSGSGSRDLRFLSREEVEALLRAVPDDDEGSRDRALYACAAWSGLRQGELAALRWRDVDWTAGVIRVVFSYTRGQHGTPKSEGSVRAVPMFDRLAGELDRHHQGSAYQADDDLVFCHPHTGTPFDASHIRSRFHKARKAAGVREVRFHDLRHTFGTQMAAAGCPLRTLQGYMGHANYQTTEVYAKHAPDLTRGAAWARQAFGVEEVADAEAEASIQASI